MTRYVHFLLFLIALLLILAFSQLNFGCFPDFNSLNKPCKVNSDCEDQMICYPSSLRCKLYSDVAVESDKGVTCGTCDNIKLEDQYILLEGEWIGENVSLIYNVDTDNEFTISIPISETVYEVSFTISNSGVMNTEWILMNNAGSARGGFSTVEEKPGYFYFCTHYTSDNSLLSCGIEEVSSTLITEANTTKLKVCYKNKPDIMNYDSDEKTLYYDHESTFIKVE